MPPRPGYTSASEEETKALLQTLARAVKDLQDRVAKLEESERHESTLREEKSERA